MTGPEMNASLAKKTRAALTAAAATVALGGCLAMGPFDTETDQTSPVAARVDALVAANTAYPRWEDFPARPTDIPSAQVIRAEVHGLETAQAGLAADAAAIDWTMEEDPEVFAERIRAAVSAKAAAPVDVQRTQAEIEAFAEELRRRATAPPPVPRD